jgi:hypothetical protein
MLIVGKNPGLKSIRVPKCHNCVDEKSLKLIATLKDLEVLDISFCTKVDSAALLSFRETVLNPPLQKGGPDRSTPSPVPGDNGHSAPI